MPEKHLTESNILEAEVKLHDPARREAFAAGDGMKFKQGGLHSNRYVSEFARLLAADGPSARLEILVEKGCERDEGLEAGKWQGLATLLGSGWNGP